MKRIGALAAAILWLAGGILAGAEAAEPAMIETEMVLEEDSSQGKTPDIQQEEIQIEESTEQAPGETEYTSLSVGNPTPMSGRFFTDMWGNATSDIDVRNLLHAYDLVIWDVENAMFTVDPTVVSGIVKMANEEGDHIYTLALYDDLYYSDGSRITAWDYAFSWLLTMSPEIRETGAARYASNAIAGSEAYASGGGVLKGVRVLGDDMLSVTLSHEALPYFYEMGLLDCVPYPISQIAPGVTVRDDGEGVSLASADGGEVPLFTAELLARTILDPEKGYMSHPAVVSGPYTLQSWDGKKAEFEINPYYKRETTEQVPAINHLTYTAANIDTLAEQLETGEFGLVNKITRTDVISNLLDRMDGAELSMSSYPRVGLSFISFLCEKEKVRSQAVRQAIACCFDRDAVLEAYTGNYGIRVDGYYGVGQWMYRLVAGNVEPSPDGDGTEEKAYGELSLEGMDAYPLDMGRAASLLEADGWKLNADGIREKDGVRLELRMVYPEGNNIVGVLREHLAAHLDEVGIRLTMEAMPMDQLLRQWYGRDERNADMIYLASNLDPMFDLAAQFVEDKDGNLSWYYTQFADEELYQLAETMDRTEPGDVLTYMQRWIAFQERFNKTLPMIPVYSNTYFDFYTRKLRNYQITESVTWGEAIVGAYLSDEEPVEEDTEEARGDDELSF